MLINKYGLKATFNLNSCKLGMAGSLIRENMTVPHVKFRPCEIKDIYSGHDVASHTKNHPLLTKMTDEEIISEVEEDRLTLSELVGYEVTGFAYPCGGVNADERVAGVIRKNTGIKYGRTIVSSGNFELPENPYLLKPTVYHHTEFDKLFTLADEFIKLEPDTPKLFYIWGHAYEFDIHDDWERFEEFLKLISGKNDIYYCTGSQALLDK